jgi:hypothetical protein
MLIPRCLYSYHDDRLSSFMAMGEQKSAFWNSSVVCIVHVLDSNPVQCPNRSNNNRRCTLLHIGSWAHRDLVAINLIHDATCIQNIELSKQCYILSLSFCE